MRRLHYFFIPILLVTFTSCILIPNQNLADVKNYETDLKDKTFKKDLTISGTIDPKLKVTLTAQFEATNMRKGCFKSSSGWSTFSIFTATNSSFGKSDFELSMPIKWENSLGVNECDYALKSISLQVSLPLKEKKEFIDSLDLLLVASNERNFRIDGKTYFNTARDYKVRYITGLSYLKCNLNKEDKPKLSCMSDLNASTNIKKSDDLPSTLSYGVTISLKE